MNITIKTQGVCSMSIDIRSGQIQVQGEHEFSIESEPEILISGSPYQPFMDTKREIEKE